MFNLSEKSLNRSLNKLLHKIVIRNICFIFCSLAACTPEKGKIASKPLSSNLSKMSVSQPTLSDSKASSNKSVEVKVLNHDQINYLESELDKKLDVSYRIRNFSVFQLDDPLLTIEQPAIGLKQFMDSQTPYITFVRPKDSDYAEILRCNLSTSIQTVSQNYSYDEISGISTSKDFADKLVSEDIFGSAQSDTKNCELISDGSTLEDFPDSWAPSGSFFYILRSCINPARIVDSDKLTTRNCSRRITFSSTLVDYVNERKDKENELLRNLSLVESKADQLAARIKFLSNTWLVEVKKCEDTEHARVVDTNRKNAIVTVIDAVLELRIEFATVKGPAAAEGGYAKHYFQSGFGGYNDLLQVFNAVGGFSLGVALHELVSTASDMPRSCYEGIKIDTQISTAVREYMLTAEDYLMARWSIEANKADQGAAAGKDVTAPDVPAAPTGQ